MQAWGTWSNWICPFTPALGEGALSSQIMHAHIPKLWDGQPMACVHQDGSWAGPEMAMCTCTMLPRHVPRHGQDTSQALNSTQKAKSMRAGERSPASPASWLSPAHPLMPAGCLLGAPGQGHIFHQHGKHQEPALPSITAPGHHCPLG